MCVCNFIRRRIAVISIAAAASAFPLLAQQDPYPNNPGKDVFLRVCSVCHGPEMVLGQNTTRDGWVTIVSSMADRGAQASDAEFNQIVDYLTKSFPPAGAASSVADTKINVNKAASADLQTSLGFSAKEADAIVAYRQKNGDFKSIDDLKKVPDVTAAKVDAVKDRLSF